MHIIFTSIQKQSQELSVSYFTLSILTPRVSSYSLAVSIADTDFMHM